MAMQAPKSDEVTVAPAELTEDRGQATPESPGSMQAATTSPAAGRPGALRGASVMTVKTHLAQQLVFGRPGRRGHDGKRAIIGLIGFAGMLKPIFTAAQLDDPYADQWLLDIETAIESATSELAELREAMAQALAQRPDVQHTVAQSVKPLEVPLYFSNQLAFRAAYLVNDFDSLVCAAQTAKHVAVITTVTSNAVIQRGSKSIRRTLTSATGYRYTGVSRADIAYGTAKAHEALKRWGEVQPDILNGSRRAEYGPPLPADSYAPRIAAESEVTGE